MKQRQIALGILLFASIAAAIYVSRQDQAEVVEVISRPGTIENMEAKKELLVVDRPLFLTNRDWDMTDSQNLFASRIKPVPAQVVAAAAITATPPVPVQVEPPKPVAPPLPFVYVGKIVEDGRPLVFIAKADRNYSIRGGEIIDGIYAVKTIEPQRVVFKYIPLAVEQTLNIGERN